MGGLCCKDSLNETKFSQAPNKKNPKWYTPNMKNFKNLRKVEGIKEIYNLKAILGEGSFGTVYKGEHKVSNNLYAIKVVKKDKVEDNPVLDGLLK